MDTSDEWITTRTGIRARHWCTETNPPPRWPLRPQSRRCSRSGLAPADIACCVCATLSAPDATPSVACQVQAALGLPENRPALDVNAACSGFSLRHRCGAGTAGDAGRAVCPCHRVRSPFPPDGPHRPLHLRTVRRRGRRSHLWAGRHPLCPHAGGPGQRRPPRRRAEPQGSAPITMDGKAVFRFAVDALPRCLHAVLEETGKRWTSWTGWSAIRPTAASSTTVCGR